MYICIYEEKGIENNKCKGIHWCLKLKMMNVHVFLKLPPGINLI